MATLYTDQQAPSNFEGQTKDEYLADIENCEVAYADEDFPQFIGMSAEQIFEHYVQTGFVVELPYTQTIEIILDDSIRLATHDDMIALKEAVLNAVSTRYPDHDVSVDLSCEYRQPLNTDVIKCDPELTEEIEFLIKQVDEQG